MSGVEKIKKALTGRHEDKTSKQNSAACEERGAQHHTGHAHHDPEPETKKATSAAGNYPYWGNLSRNNHSHRHEPGSDSREPQHSHAEDSSVGSGALATGTGAAGAGYLASEDRREPDPLYASTRSAQTATSNQPAGAASQSNPYSGGDNNNNNHTREEEALAAGTGVVGAGYLASKKKDDRKDEQQHTAASAPGTQTNATAASSSRHDPASEIRKATAAAGNYPYRDDNKGDHKKEGELLGAGAGAAGLAGAGYLASRDRKDEQNSSTAPGSTQGGTGALSSGQHHHDPEIDARKATSAAGNYPHWGENQKKRDEEILGAGAGAAGLAGAGYYGSKKIDETTTGAAAPSSSAKRDTTARNADVSAGTPGQAHSTGNHDSYRREEEALAATGGLGAAGIAGMEAKKRHDNKRPTEESAQPNSTATSATGLTPAQRAAQQAWIQTEIPSATNDAHSHTRDNNVRSDMEYAAAGAATGAGAAGLASKHGHGKYHEDSPRTQGSAEAGRYAPSSQAGVASSSGVGSTRDPGILAGSTGGLGKAGHQSKVLHKCEQCGHDNDISHYFGKDSANRPGQ